MLTVESRGRYGAFESFQFSVPDGYQVLVGANNAGKSTLLQMAFRQAYQESANYGQERIALLLSDRDYIFRTTETGGRSLRNHNDEIMSQIQGGPWQYEVSQGSTRSELPRLLLNHTNFRAQLDLLEKYLLRLGFPEPTVRGAQQVFFDDVLVQQQGTGLRSLVGILAALSDPALRLICIDEPELSLEPSLQKTLRDLLIENATEGATAGRTILVATHSHLFLNRRQPTFNHVLRRSTNGLVRVDQVRSDDELLDLTFGLLGNDTEDLFFPGNYMVTEGSSDQALCERGLALQQTPGPRVKILAAGGVTSVKNTIDAVIQSLRPLTTHDSPYAGRVVALIDQPVTEREHQREAEIRVTLGDRLFVLSQPSLEEYIPPELYTKAGRDKQADLAQLKNLTNDFKALGALKREICTQIAQQLTLEDFDQLPVIRDAVNKALNWGQALGVPGAPEPGEKVGTPSGSEP